MKYILFAIIGLVLSLNGMAQDKKTKRSKKSKKQETESRLNEPAMTNALDSFSYALGLSMAGFYKEQGVENINTALVTKALNDSRAGKPLLDENQINDAIISFMQSAKGQKAEPNKKIGQAFLDSNKTKPGVVTRPSGLQYKIITAGTGRKPSVDDKVRVHYHGMLLDGKVFDSSVERGEPIELNVNEVISGWTEALQLMPVGSKWQLYIPSDLAYGDAGAGADIPPGSTLIFDVELLDILK